MHIQRRVRGKLAALRSSGFLVLDVLLSFCLLDDVDELEMERLAPRNRRAARDSAVRQSVSRLFAIFLHGRHNARLR